MGHFEQMLSSETQFTGHIFTVTLDQVRLEDGTIIATDPSYVPLLLSGYYYTIQPTVSNQF